MKKKWIKMNLKEEEKPEVIDVVEESEENKEESKMNFFAKHKKGLIIGGLSALAAGAVGLLIANKGSDDDVEGDFEDLDEDIFEDDETAGSDDEEK